MAAKGPKGSILLEILIVLMALLLVAVILVPNKIWKEENAITKISRDNMNAIYEAERFYYQKNNSYTDSLSKLLTFVHSDSGLQQGQTLVSLTRSFLQIIDNILNINSINNISKVSLAYFEITGDLVGNERYFRRIPEILQTSQEIIREMSKLDSSIMIPNFSRTKLFIDSLRGIRESISDFPLQIAILRAINYVDSINLYFNRIEKGAVNEFWSEEYKKISQFISDIRKTDINKVSSVSDRLNKFIDQINSNLTSLQSANDSQDRQSLEAERQNLTELHQKFLSPEFFFLTKRYGLASLNETDSILIDLNQDNFYCPDSKELYIIDTTNRHLTVESPNLLNLFHKRFLEDVQPIRDFPFYHKINEIDTVFSQTLDRLNNNKNLLRRYTDLLLNIKEISAEMESPSNSIFYKYSKNVQEFISLLDHDKKLSVLKPAIEDILNPLDTLATHIQDNDTKDLQELLDYYNDKLLKVDSLIAGTRLPSRLRKKIQSNAEIFKPSFDILAEINKSLDPTYAKALHDAAKSLGKDLLNALEGENETMYVIFKKKHINHGFIKDGEKSWEEQ